jgi:hypothetical protein
MNPARFSEQQIGEVKARTNLVELVLKMVALEKRGDRWFGLCPFHAEKTGSFMVYPSKGFFHCFGCGASGDCFTWLELVESRSFPDAVRTLGIRAGLVSGREWAPRKVLQPIVALPAKPEEVKARQQRDWQRASELWQRAVDPRGTKGEIYWEARGLGTEVPRCYRYLSALDYREADPRRGGERVVIGSFPALVAKVTYRDKLTTVHRTYLSPDGSKKAEIAAPWAQERALAARKLMGPPGHGAIMLTEPLPVMLCGEGGETTWAAHLRRRDAGAMASISINHMAGSGKGQGSRHPVRPTKQVPSREPDMDKPGVVFPPEPEEWILLQDADSRDLHAIRALLERAQRRIIRLGKRAWIASPPRGLDYADWNLRALRGEPGAA